MGRIKLHQNGRLQRGRKAQKEVTGPILQKKDRLIKKRRKAQHRTSELHGGKTLGKKKKESDGGGGPPHVSDEKREEKMSPEAPGSLDSAGVQHRTCQKKFAQPRHRRKDKKRTSVE